MTPEAQRIAIAEFCGWREAFPDGKQPHPETKKGGILLPYKWVNEITHQRLMDLPDYLNDLNAIYEATRILTQIQKELFIHNLMAVCLGQAKAVYGFASSDTFTALWLGVFATAPQRAEALLKTIGKWEK